MRVPCEEVAHALIFVLKLLVRTGHMRSFDAIPLRESAKSTLLIGVSLLASLLMETLSIERHTTCCLGSIHLVLGMLCKGL